MGVGVVGLDWVESMGLLIHLVNDGACDSEGCACYDKEKDQLEGVEDFKFHVGVG